MRRFLRPIPLAVTAATGLVLYTLVGFFLIPYIIKDHVLPAVSEKLKKPVLAKEVAFNPFLLSLRLTGFEIQEPDGLPMLGFEEFFVDFETVSIFKRAYVFDAIRFAVPYVAVRVAKDGHVNLTDLVPPADPSAAPPPADDTKPKGEIPAVQIGRFEIAQGVVEFRDESKPKPFSIDIVPINLALSNFHTKPGGDNTYSFTAELGKGEVLDWKGTISLEPIRSEGQLSLDGVKIATFFQYLQDQFNFDIPAGTIQAKGRYRFDAAASPIDLIVSDTSLHLADVGIHDKGDPAPVITVPKLGVDGIEVDLKKRALSIASVTMTGATDHVWRNPDGTLNLQLLFTPVAQQGGTADAAASTPAPTAPEPPWTIVVKDVSVTNHTVHFEDRTTMVPMRTDVVVQSARTHDLSLPDIRVIPLTVEQTINGTGLLKLDGQMLVKPFQADFVIGMKRLDLPPFQPYLDKPTRISLDSGSIDLDGVFHLAVEHPKAPMMTFHGNFGLNSLAVSHRDDASSVATLKQLSLRQIALALDPTSVTIEEIGLDQPHAHLLVHEDGTLNVSQLGAPAASVGTEDAAPSKDSAPKLEKKTPPVSVSVKQVKLLKGAVSFEDQSIEPYVRTGLQDLTGSIKGLSSKRVAKADVELSGRVDHVAPLKIVGQINPLTEDAFTDLTVKFDNVNLIAASPYSGKFAGYPIQKGKLFLDLAYKVSEKQLEAENKVVIDQLTFGEKTNSPDATSLPVPLAVALLKDRKGRIEIDLPIRGDLANPDFKYGKVVWSTLGNILMKIVASPFSLMGKLIPGGGDGEDLQFVAFEPGSGSLLDGEVKKLETLAKGLEERPGLRLEITGTADPDRDRRALASQQLQARVLAKWRQDKGAPKETAVPADEEARLIKELFDQQFGKPSATPVASPAGPPTPAPKPPTMEEMKQRLVDAMPMDENALRALAKQRADSVRERIVTGGKLPEERLFVTDVNLTATGQELVRSTLSMTAGS